MEPVLDARALVKTYGATVALDGVGLSVGPGELVGLLGPNGAGKSTLVKICCGLVKADGGEVAVSGSPAGSDVARRSIGYLAELFRFPGWLRAHEVIELHQELAGSDGGAGEVDRLLDLVGLGAVRSRRVDAMSKGMQQRLGIAQALVGSPRLLMLDEPTSALDPAGRRAVREILETIRGRGIAVLLNSHLLSEVELVCDRVVILNAGRVIAQGSPADLSATKGVEIETSAGIKRWPDAARADTPELVAELVAAGEQVFAVRPITRSLEDIYIEVLEEAEIR
ncbi:MAG TPA: ABC transporter ATP-binding protein [Actinomycetota bacterium]|nr:ABC transporter ATP-binding protein [Actinomycetota bacterium]